MLKSHGVGPSLMASLALVLVVGAPVAPAAGSPAFHTPSPGATGDGQRGVPSTPAGRLPAGLLTSGAGHRHRLKFLAANSDQPAQSAPVPGPGRGERVPTAPQPPQLRALASRPPPLQHRLAPTDLTQAGRPASPPAGARLAPGVRARSHAGLSRAADGFSAARKPEAVALAGVLTITVPGTASIGSVVRGNTISASMGSVNVLDQRMGSTSWVASVSATNLTTGAGSPAETIAKSNIAYWSGVITASSGGGIRIAGQDTAAQKVPLSTTVTAFSGSKTVGTTMTRFAPTLVVTIPALAVVGTYTAVITHSVV